VQQLSIYLCLNEMTGILDVFGLERSPDYTSFSVWDSESPMQELRHLLRREPLLDGPQLLCRVRSFEDTG